VRASPSVSTRSSADQSLNHASVRVVLLLVRLRGEWFWSAGRSAGHADCKAVVDEMGPAPTPLPFVWSGDVAVGGGGMVARNDDGADNFDFIIVGSGAAGSVLAERLSADGRFSVLVVEAGGRDRDVRLRIPIMSPLVAANSRWSGSLSIEPSRGSQPEQWPYGRVLGGSTTINGSTWNRGSASSHAVMEEEGGAAWSWDNFVEAFRDVEDHQLGSAPSRGAGGPLPISIAGPHDAASDRLIEAFAAHQVRAVDDFNDVDEPRIGYTPSTTRRGWRVSAASAFLRPARHRPNVTVLTGTEVHKVVFQGTRAVGVLASSTTTGRGHQRIIRARHEVLLCAGAMSSPLILERSGIGRPDVLDAAGVAVLVPSPRVGEGLRQHRGLLFPMRLTEPIGYNPVLSSFGGRIAAFARYAATGRGVISLGGGTVMAMLRAHPDSEHADTQMFFAPMTADLNPRPGATLGFYPAFPTSEGSVHTTGPSITDSPRVSPHYLETTHDQNVTRCALERLRSLLSQPPIAELLEREPLEGPSHHARDTAALTEFVQNRGFTGYHAVGTCALGASETAVLDQSLRVRGTDGLRVVDASSFPALTAGNNMAPTMALAWIAARQILAHGV